MKGKIVQCNISPEPADYVIKEVGGTGVIIEIDDNTYMDTAFISMAPATFVNATVGHTISHYITSIRYIYIYTYRQTGSKLNRSFACGPGFFCCSFYYRCSQKLGPLAVYML